MEQAVVLVVDDDLVSNDALGDSDPPGLGFVCPDVEALSILGTTD
jgi:hypothetical protein